MLEESFVSAFQAELQRIGLDPTEIQALAISGDTAKLLAHVRALPVGSSWADVLPGVPEGWSPRQRPPERALGPFDYQEPPWSIAIFASLDSGTPEADGEAAIRRARSLGIPLHGAGVILDRGHPHVYVVLARGVPVDDADLIADALRFRHGVGNAFPIVRDGTDDDA